MPRTGTIQRTGTFPRTDTMLTYRSQRTKHRGFGGFPMPHEIISRLINWWFPDFKRNLTRTVTIPRTQTITSQNAVNLVPGARPVSYITFEAIVGRNSNFQELTREELDELGGVEYRGLSALLWIVGGVSYHPFGPLSVLTYFLVSYWNTTHRVHRHCALYFHEKVASRLYTARLAQICFSCLVCRFGDDVLAKLLTTLLIGFLFSKLYLHTRILACPWKTHRWCRFRGRFL